MIRLEDIIQSSCPELKPLPTGTEPRLNKLRNVKAVLFDIYGTLFVSGSGDVGTASATNTAEALTQALVVSGFEGDLELAGRIGKDMLKSEIIEWHTVARETGTDFPEVEISKVWKKIIDSMQSTETLKSSQTDFDQIRRLAVEYECRVNPVFPMPESLETIEQLKNKGLALGIVSNAQFYTPLLFNAFFEKDIPSCGFTPECCIWSYKELKAKPSATLFPKVEKFLQLQHNISLKETVYVGNDMLNDIFCAKQAGCQTVLFAGDQRSLRLRETDERCIGLEPDAVITSLTELLDII